MCGIAGGVWLNAQTDIKERLDAALTSMHSRGPDYSLSSVHNTTCSKVGMAHNRLSIIDLSSAAVQPMTSQDENYIITYNGEIYNYLELRTELLDLGVCFSTESDTEVLLAAWIYWGESCLSRLVGMFAFAIYDITQGTLTCVRDAFGVKPFYYSKENGDFLFASALPALCEMKRSELELSLQSAYDYLVHGYYDVGEDSFISDVSVLPAASLMVVDITTGFVTRKERWWTPCVVEKSVTTYSEAVKKIRELFLKSVDLHLRSDVKIGAALSGGVDSSAIVCAIRYLQKDKEINTFSYIADGDKTEECWIDAVNEFTRSKEHKVHVDSDSLLADLEDMITAQGEPFGSSSIYAQYKVYEAAKASGVVVMLDGQGADEVLAGYIGYPGARLHSLFDGLNLVGFLKFLRGWSSYTGLSVWKGLAYFLSNLTSGNVHQYLRRFSGRSATPKWIRFEYFSDAGVVLKYPKKRSRFNQRKRRVMNELALSITSRGLPALLRHADRNSMRFSVESRVPFLTIEMADYLLSLPEQYLISMEGKSKSIFRDAMEAIVPQEILARSDKIGFETPELKWMIEKQEEIYEILEGAKDVPLLNGVVLLDYFNEMVSGKRAFSWLVWRWVNFLIWYKCFFVERSG